MADEGIQTAGSLEFILSIVELVLKYGVPGVISIIQSLQDKTDLTLDEIIALRDRVPDPEIYFNP